MTGSGSLDRKFIWKNRKRTEMDSALMSCSWIRKQTMRDRRRTAKAEARKVVIFLLKHTHKKEKKRTEDFWDGIHSIFYFDGDDV